VKVAILFFARLLFVAIYSIAVGLLTGYIYSLIVRRLMKKYPQDPVYSSFKAA
jgi:NhaP-type Na+/H+ or K+/H+ antiporter